MNRMLVLLILLALATPMGACGDRSKTTGPSETTTLTVINDSTRHHLGDEFREEFLQREPEGLERSYTFVLDNPAVSANLQLVVYDMDLIGATVTINGIEVLFIPPPAGDRAVVEVALRGSVFRLGSNRLTVRSVDRSESLASIGDAVEDFEYDGLKLVVTVKSPA